MNNRFSRPVTLSVAAVLVAVAILACKSSSSKREDYAKELTASLPKGCEANSMALGSLTINCNTVIVQNHGSDISSAVDSVKTRIKADCARLKKMEFHDIQLSADTLYKWSDSDPDCELTSN